MHQKVLMIGRVMAAVFLLLRVGGATLVPRLSFEEMTDSSEMVVAGTVTRSWTAWDSDHRYIWTHYELAVASAPKGHASARVEFAEPGGKLDGVLHSIAGTVSYQPGESVVLFLQRMPNGYLRTAGWGQGKYGLDQNQKLKGGSGLRGAEVVDLARPVAGSTSIETLDGITLSELNVRVSVRVRLAAQNAARSK
jgi:hypothetical protein